MALKETSTKKVWRQEGVKRAAAQHDENEKSKAQQPASQQLATQLAPDRGMALKETWKKVENQQQAKKRETARHDKNAE